MTRNYIYRTFLQVLLITGTCLSAAPVAFSQNRQANSTDGLQAGKGNTIWGPTPGGTADEQVQKEKKLVQDAAAVISPNPLSNFSTFSQAKWNNSAEVREYNKGFEGHPELGVVFPDAPCADCYELLDKRTETQKFFVREGSEARKFVLYSSVQPMHYRDASGRWMTVRNTLQKDMTVTGKYQTRGRMTDVVINTQERYAELVGRDGSTLRYNNNLELVYIQPDGTETSLGHASWANASVGDNGVRIKDAWPGIDIEMTVLAAGFKTGFILKNAMPAYAAGKLAIRDHMKPGTGVAINMPEGTPFTGEITIGNNNKDICKIGAAYAYELNAKEPSETYLNYRRLPDNVVDILVPGALTDKAPSAYPIVIDPLATGILSSGFTYSNAFPPAAGFFCNNINNLAIPAGATFSDLKVTFSFYGPAGVSWGQATFSLAINGGLCPTAWVSCTPLAFSSGIPGGTCGYIPGTSFWGALSPCLPAFSCTPYTLPVELRTAQRQTPSAACVQTIYATATGFYVVAEGTLAVLPSITPSGPTTLCMPSTLALTGSPASAVWSSSAPGVATVSGSGVVTGVSNGTANIILTSGTCTATLPLTVGTTPTITGTTSICFPGTTTSALTGTPAGGVWSSSAPGVATVSGTGLVTGISVGTSIINYNTGTCSASVPFDVNSPTAVAPATQPTGLTVPSTTTTGGTINFTPNGSTGYMVVASTSSTLSATPVSGTTYATGSAFGGGIVVQGSTSGSSPSYLTSLLNSNTRYYLFVFAFNNNCVGPQYCAAAPLTGTLTTCVMAPTGLATGAPGANSIPLSWTASAPGGGYLTPINYNIYAYLDAALTTLAPGFPIMAGTVTSYTVGGLMTGTQYWFRVSPADACNIMSNVATAATVCTLPGSIPYLQTFEVGTLIGDDNPNCMTSNVQNCVLTGVATSSTFLGTIATNHTPGGTKFYGLLRGGACSAGWANQWLLLPALSLQAGTTYTFSVWYRTDGFLWQNLRFQYSTVGTVPAVTSTTMGGTPGTIGPGVSVLSPTAYTQYLQTFTVPTSGTYYIGINMESGGSASQLAIDDIEVCAVPTVTATNSAPPYCDPANAFISSTGSLWATEYLWSGPAGYSSTIANPPAITGLGPGTYTYTLTAVNDPVIMGFGGLCTATATTTFTVNPPPPSISGGASICVGQTTTLSNPLAGGTWSSSTPAVGTVSSIGVVTGIGAGTTTITYNIGGCFTTRVVTVTSSPSTITGSAAVCLGSTTTLNSTPAGGTWSSSNTAIGTVSATGVVTGIAVGTTTITYSFGGSCFTTVIVTVNANPTAIVGPATVCIGTTATYTSTPAGGFFTSSAPAIASVTLLTGVVTGNSAGTATLTYTSAGCIATRVVTVVPSPAPISGPTSICPGFPSVTFTNASTGGTWTSSNGNITIGASTGVATGVTVGGSSVISYSLSAGCFSTITVNVLSNPPAPTGTPSVCVGATTALSHGTAGGTWSVACPGIASVTTAGGVVSGLAAGTCIVTYTVPATGCIATLNVTVNNNPGAFTGIPAVVCQGATTTLANATPSGTWSSSNTAVGTISAGGILTGLSSGTTTISYILPTGCFATTVATVSAAPTPITGSFTVCAGSTTALSGLPGGGLWGVAPASAGIASVSGTGVVTGLAPGTAIVSYTTASSCFDTAIVTVLDTPTAVTGTLAICVGATTTLSSSPTGGTWASASAAIANVISTGVSGGTSTALVGGVSANTVNITYTRSNGCFRTSVLTVNALPGTITGNTPVCVTSSITLSATPVGGTWSTLSGNITVGAGTGVVTGVTAGTAVVTYSLGTGCTATTIITVNPLPATLTGPTQVCESSCITLASTSGGGTWASSNTAVGTVNTTGVVCGVAAGTTNITYTLGTGCRRVQTITVNALPAAIAGAGSVCVNQCTLLSSSPAGGTWSSSNTAVGTINAGGNFCGVSFGTTTVTYTAPTTGCIRTTVMAVNPLPTGISPAAPQVCEGSCTPVIGTPGGGIWTSSTTSVGTITSAGSFCGISAGTTTLTYTMGSGCFMTVTATVNSLPAAITGTLGVCVNRTTTLNSTTIGGTWSSGSANVSVNTTTGEVTGVAGGTATISYTLSTGCRQTTFVTVYALPTTITATPSFGVCVGNTTTLNSTPGGTWSIFNTTIGTISTVGVVTGLASSGADTTIVSYTNANGCVRETVVTVFAPPTAITGGATVCVLGTTSLNSTPAGGTWSSGAPVVASVDATTGVVTGVSGPLTATISYTLGTGCRTTQVVTVYSLPNNITGTLQICAGATTILSSPGTPGGTWSSSDITVASVDAAGVVTGNTGVMAPSTATITYTLGSGCFKTATISVNPIPTAITGTLQICETYGSTTLTGSPGPGTWSSSTTGVATINSSTGVATAGVAGTTVITYRLTTTSCYRTEVLTVNQLPSVITGPAAVCVNETVTMNSTPTGGTWSSPSAFVTVVPGTGEVTGAGAGLATLSYANGTTGCVRTGTINVNPIPNAITGSFQVCEGLTTTLATSSTGGTWTASNPAAGTIDGSGVYTGISGTPAPAVSRVSYTFVSTGCRVTADVTVNSLPATIVGSSGFCNFTETVYTSSPAGGVWTSNNPTAIDFITPTPGEATAVGVGTATITYTLPTGCIRTKDVFTIFAPYPITGADDVCVGDTVTVADTIAGGVWSISAPGIASITPATLNTAIVGGLVAGNANVTYTLSTGCFSIKNMTVNPIPSGITGAQTVCEGLTTDLDNITPGGVWSSSDVSIATVGTSDGIVNGINGGAAGNTVTITYALGTGCNAQATITVNPLPSVITGTFNVCEGLTTTLTSGGAVAGTWTSADPAVAAADPATGIISGVSAAASGVNGIGQTRITYTLATGCLRTQDFTVNALPADISGISNICENDMTVLGNATPGGTWISSNSGIATVNSFGVVTGIVGGNVVITYMLSTGCIKTWPMTVNANPDTITGALQVCAGFATNLHSGPAGGVWSSAPASNIYGTINTITGVVSGITAGLVPVTYTLGSGCNATAVVTVVNLPALIDGTASVCAGGSTTVLTHPVAGGVWSAANPSIASVDPLTGVVTGNNAGTTTVSYTVGTGCFNIRTVTVNPLPAPITGTLTVCERFSTTLSSATPGGIWISDSTHRANILSSTGVATGVSAGQAQIRYRLFGTGCTRYAVLTVNPTPDTIVGNPHICMGSANWYTDATPGGTWSIGNSAIATLLAPLTTQTVTAMPVTPGATFIQYTNTYGCYATKNVTVQPLPVVYNVTGGGSYCAGGNGVNIGLDGSQPGVSYVLYRGSIAVGYLSGTGFALNFGLLTTGGTYSVIATNANSGCGRAMAGSAVVTVITPATPTVSITAGPADSVCPGETVTLTPVATSGGTAPVYTWKINGVVVGTGATYSYVPADGDVASVQMTSNGTCLATTTASGNRTLHVLPVALPVANVIAGPNDSVCEFSMVTLSAASTYGGSSPVYWWLVNGTYTTTAPTYSYVPNNGDVVTVMMKSNYRCRTVDTVASNDVTLYVEPMLIPGVTVYPEPGYEVTAGKPVKLRAIATDAGSAPRFQWKVNGYPVAGATADTFTSIFNDYDSISCVVTSSGICGNIGTFDWAFITTSPLGVTAAEAGMDLRLHPNPNHGMFTVKGRTGLTGNGVIPAEITNMLGQVVYRGALKMTAGKVDAQLVLDGSLSSGMYLLTLTLDGQPKTFHFVLEQ